MLDIFIKRKKMKLGAKRNYMHQKTKGDIIIYMDDDDYYPPDRVNHAVNRLRSQPTALCAASSRLFIYYKHIQKIYQFGPYGPNHGTAGTFAFRKELLLKHSIITHNGMIFRKRKRLNSIQKRFVLLRCSRNIPQSTIICSLYKTYASN